MEKFVQSSQNLNYQNHSPDNPVGDNTKHHHAQRKRKTELQCTISAVACVERALQMDPYWKWELKCKAINIRVAKAVK